MTMKIAITNLANRSGDELIVRDGEGGKVIPPSGTRVLRRGETMIIDETNQFTLSFEGDDGQNDAFVGTPNLLVTDPPQYDDR